MKTILIDVLNSNITVYVSSVGDIPVTEVIESFIGIHRVDQLGGIVYKGYIHDDALEDLKEELGWFAFGRHKYPNGVKVYIKEEFDGWNRPEEIIEYKKVLKRRRWTGTCFVPTIGPV